MSPSSLVQSMFVRSGVGRPHAVALLLACVLAAAPARAQAPLHFVDDDTRVRAISFKHVDSETLEERQLEAQIATKEPSFVQRVKRVLPLLSGDYPVFSPVELQKDVIRLERYYQSNGFLHPEIDYPATQLDTTDNMIHVVFTVVEGPPLIIQDVGFYAPTGSYAYEQFTDYVSDRWIEFRDDVTVEIGTRYTRFQGIRIQDQVLSWLQNAGFAFAEVDMDALIDSSANTVDLRFHVDPGPRGYVDEILVEGNESVPDRVLLREVPLTPGDRFSYKKMVRGQRELFSLNLFRVALADVPEQPVDSTVTVRYRVREALPRHLSAQTGYARDAGLLGEAEWRHRNFLGGARLLTVTGGLRSGLGGRAPQGFDAVTRRLNATVSLRQPYLWSTRLSGILAPFYVWEENPSLHTNFWEVGLNTTALFEIYTFRNISLQHTFSRAFGDTTPIRARLADPTSTNRRDIYNRNIFSLSATLGDVDDFLSPTSGFLVRPFAEVGADFGTLLDSGVNYYKVSTEVVAYRRLSETVDVAGRFYVGRLWPIGESRAQRNPIVETRFDRIRFTAGGASDVRGWASDLLGPVRLDSVYTTTDAGNVVLVRDVDTGFPVVEYESIGGLAKRAANLEVRMPFPGLSNAWRTAAFVDAGQVAPEGAWTAPVRVGVGGGFRYETLVGFIRLDLAYKVNPKDEDLASAQDILEARLDPVNHPLERSFWNRFRLHLSIGQAF